MLRLARKLECGCQASAFWTRPTVWGSRTYDRETHVGPSGKGHQDQGRPAKGRVEGNLAAAQGDSAAALAAYARRILSLTDEALATVKNARFQETITLGTTVSLAQSILPSVLGTFARQEPNVQIQVDCDRSNALLERLAAGEIDIAFMLDQGKRTGRVFAESTPLVWAGSSDFNPEAWPDVPLVFLTDGRDLRRHAFDALDRAGRKGHIAYQCPHPVGLRAFVLSGLALTVMAAPSVSLPLKSFGPHEGLPQLGSTVLSLYRAPGHQSAAAETLGALLNAAARTG